MLVADCVDVVEGRVNVAGRAGNDCTVGLGGRAEPIDCLRRFEIAAGGRLELLFLFHECGFGLSCGTNDRLCAWSVSAGNFKGNLTGIPFR